MTEHTPIVIAALIAAACVVYAICRRLRDREVSR